MKIPALDIGDIHAPFPLIQGGMGVRVSLARLAAAVANEGAIGTIASVGLGDIEASKTDFDNVSRNALIHEIRRAKSMTDGLIAVNIMGVLSNARDLVETSVREGIKLIVSGASLPLKLPEMIDDPTVKLLPIISSGRAADLVLRTWDRRYSRTADAVILEGPLAGGHLGFSFEQLREPEKYSLTVLLPEVLAAVEPFEKKYGRKIPVIAGGGIFTGADIARMLQAGAAGVQMATRFVCTDECEVAPEFKQAYLDAKEEDIVLIQSPVGLPGRAIHNQFLRNLEADTLDRLKCPYRCLTTCNIAEARYCIALALVSAYKGDMDKGLVFCGQNAYRVNKVVTVKELIAELRAEIEAY
ncbi:MAG TPA: nitronate monooxygenase family protein [Acidobacteriota bacterium]|nr:nitronate monooxygenase family protein [Acidobacteriota bacterium]